MILVDTSVWIGHLHSGDENLSSLLESSRVLMHPFIPGEIACENLANRGPVLSLLAHLPRCSGALDTEVLAFIEHHKLMGRGIGFIDAHLLAATRLSGSARLWTRSKRLAIVAQGLNCHFCPD